jgi:hypothetical protein
VERLREKRIAYRDLVGRLEGMRPLAKARRMSENNIKMDF